MLIGRIRPIEVREATVEGNSLKEIATKLADMTPAGFELTDAPVTMTKGSTALTAAAKFARVDGIREVEADNMHALQAKLPDGWRLLDVCAL